MLFDKQTLKAQCETSVRVGSKPRTVSLSVEPQSNVLRGEGFTLNTTYDPAKVAGNMHLTEAEIRLALQMDNDLCRFESSFESIKPAGTLILTGIEPASGHKRGLWCRLRLFSVEGGVTIISDWEAGTMGIGNVDKSFRHRPHCKMFEAVILQCERYDREPGDEVFGLLFPGGHAILVDSGPEDDYTNRRIWAMLALLGDGAGA